MARHVRFHTTGGPEVLQIDDVPTPEPKAGEVRISVRALGLNRAESMYRSGRYVIEPSFPATMGYEASGVIDAVGQGVSNLAVGDAVAVIPAFMFDQYGLYGDLVIAPARAVVKNPAGVSWEAAAATWMPFTTAWGALIDLAGLGKGDFVVLSAASSSVGLAAMQIAESVGATPIAITRNGEKLDDLKKAGFAHVLQTGLDDITAEILRITGGAGARVVFDPVGGPEFEHIVKATSKDAIVHLWRTEPRHHAGPGAARSGQAHHDPRLRIHRGHCRRRKTCPCQGIHHRRLERWDVQASDCQGLPVR
ncbi:zinc-dependent alcohol dehydrogenase family protein [Xanthomonas campestris]|uniref:zinc-dependent alcohol dehydrogenase family protein n=1 Tax=Xanthomonas campestris TaxID=339 RepID=UPI000A6A8624